MVYVDKIFDWPGKINQAARKHGRKWCHLWSDDEEELHAFALQIGLKREWFQRNRTLNHYDLVPSKRVLAIQKGAVEMDITEWLMKTKHSKQPTKEES